MRQCTFCGGKGEAEDPFYCMTCLEDDCHKVPCHDHPTCWASHFPNSQSRRHTPVEPLSGAFIKAVMFSESNKSAESKCNRKELHAQDSLARWFNITRDRDGAELNIYDRFMQLCNPNRWNSPETPQKYPSFVSFIGDTSAGKSSLIRAMSLLGILSRHNALDLETVDSEEKFTAIDQILQPGKHIPVTRSADPNSLTNPTTYGVHLYTDGAESTTLSDAESRNPSPFPMFFVDCEGFGAAGAVTDAQRNEESFKRNLLHRVPVTAGCYSEQGKGGVDLFYARFLYAISDVIIFATKEDQKIQGELIRIMEWASAAVFKSVNHPSRKTLIIVRNNPDQHYPEHYDTENLYLRYLLGHKNLWEESSILKEFVDQYNEKEETYRRRIDSNQRLYEVLFTRIVCCYIPRESKLRNSPRTLFGRYRALRDQIEASVRESQELRRASLIKCNMTALAHILNRAFEHFSTSEEPFNFYTAAMHNNISPQSMAEHIANFLRHSVAAGWPSSDRKNVVENVITVCFQIYTTRNFTEDTPGMKMDLNV
jgi:hypothetical protein